MEVFQESLTLNTIEEHKVHQSMLPNTLITRDHKRKLRIGTST